MFRNINACKELAVVTRTSYGPNGMLCIRRLIVARLRIRYIGRRGFLYFDNRGVYMYIFKSEIIDNTL